VAHVEEKSVKGFGGKARRNHSEDQGLDERMGSEWFLGRLAGGVDSVGSGWRKVEGSCERSDEPSGSGATELGT
jgi:hypothetical protein